MILCTLRVAFAEQVVCMKRLIKSAFESSEPSLHIESTDSIINGYV